MWKGVFFIKSIFLNFFYFLVILIFLFLDILISGILFVSLMNLFQNIDTSFWNFIQYGFIVILIQLSLFLLYSLISLLKDN
jgi:hypothetical protein